MTVTSYARARGWLKIAAMAPVKMAAVALPVSAILASCANGEYGIELRFDPDSLRQRARAIDVFVVPSCAEAGRDGADPASSSHDETFLLGQDAPPLGRVPSGTVGVYARSRDDTCTVFAAGCGEAQVKAHGDDTIVVNLLAVSGAGCGPGTVCLGGACVSGDAGGAGDGGAAGAGLAGFALLGPSTGTVVYVAPSGDDGATGTMARPWRTLDRALMGTAPGTTIQLRAGSYPGLTSATPNGTMAAPITIEAFPGEQAVVTNQLHLHDASYVRVSGLVFDGTTTGVDGNLLVFVDNSHHIQIADNEILNARISGVYTGNSHDVFVLRNRIHNIGFYGADSRGIAGEYDHSLIAGNVVFDGAGRGILLFPSGSGSILTGNTIVANLGSAITIDGNSAGTPSNDLMVDNIMAFNGGYGIDDANNVPASNEARSNIEFGNGQGGVSSSTGHVDTHDNVALDPLFVDRGTPVAAGPAGTRPPPVTRNLHLLATSPALGRADPSFVMATDIDGHPRPSGSGADLGAYEQ